MVVYFLMLSSCTMNVIEVDVVSAEERIFSGSARFVSLPGELGELGIFPGHTPLISRIRPGMVRIKTDDKSEELIFVAGGILEVQPKVVTVLADTAIRGKDLDEKKAEEARRRAEKELKTIGSKIAYIIAQTELAYSTAQINAIKKLRKNSK